MTTKQRYQLTNINRLMIFSLTVVGLVMDWPQAADLFFSVASCIWLWMPGCMRMQVQLYLRADVAEVDVDCSQEACRTGSDISTQLEMMS